MKTATEQSESIGSIRAFALLLWNDGYRANRDGAPLDRAKPLIPSVLAERFELGTVLANQVNHCLVVWSHGTVPVGEFDAI